jgi:hypothetical protein
MTRTMSRLLLGIATLGLVALIGGRSAEAQVEYSAWDSSYGPYRGGPTTRAQIQFNDLQGDYDTRRGTGDLSDVTYHRDQNTGAVETIDGYWSYVGQDGWFEFDLNRDGTSFHGQWGYGTSIGRRPQGYWHGRRIPGPARPPDEPRRPRRSR